jgi:hypothetical protein
MAGQFLHQNLIVVVEHFYKLLQYSEVESRCKQLAMGSPLLACRTVRSANLFHLIWRRQQQEQEVVTKLTGD